MLRKTSFSIALMSLVGGAFAAPSAGPTPINTVQDLEAINHNLAGQYILMQDIDLSGLSLNPIGSAQDPFTGSFNGNGHILQNLNMNMPKTNNTGLFASIGQGAMVENLTIHNANVTGWVSTGILAGVNAGMIDHVIVSGNVTGYMNTGGLIGANNAGSVLNCQANVTVSATNNFAGGLIGGNSEGMVENSIAIATVNDVDGSHVGGLMGDNYNGNVTTSYAEGSVVGADNVGGLTGGNDMGAFKNDFANVSVNGSGDFVGGFTGDNIESGSLENVYSLGHVAGGGIVGGLVGYNESTVNHAYWDLDTSGQAESGGGVGETDAAMRSQETYQNWDFQSIWQMQQYPILRQ